MTSAPEARIADALSDIRESTWRLGPLMRSVYRLVMSDVIAAHHLVPLLERVPGVRTSDLARGRGVSMSTVSRQVDQLVHHGWVRTEPDPDDQRAHRLYLTDEATARLASARQDIAAICQRRLGAERADRLIDAAAALREAVDALAELSDEPPCSLRAESTSDAGQPSAGEPSDAGRPAGRDRPDAGEPPPAGDRPAADGPAVAPGRSASSAPQLTA